MKELKKYGSFLLMAFAIMAIGCTKEGPQGPAGTDGVDGIDGIDGAAGTAGCITCHTGDNEIFLKVTQFEHSTHFMGGKEHVGYANYSNGACSMCHSHDGFHAAVEGQSNSGGLHPEAMPMNCYTCHQIHKTYTREDYAMVYTGAVNLIMNDAAYFTDLSIDAGEPSNTCVKCHQTRTRGADTPDLNSTENKTITSSTYGPHYGAQGIVFGGKGGYADGTFEKGKHNCVRCHVTNAAQTGNYGAYFGGHQMSLSSSVDDGEGNITYTAFTAACTECHSSLGTQKNFDLNGIQAGVKVKLDALRTALIDGGILDGNSERIITGKSYTQQQLAAFWNYKIVKDDGSYGIHNKDYTNALLDKALSLLSN